MSSLLRLSARRRPSTLPHGRFLSTTPSFLHAGHRHLSPADLDACFGDGPVSHHYTSNNIHPPSLSQPDVPGPSIDISKDLQAIKSSITNLTEAVNSTRFDTLSRSVTDIQSDVKSNLEIAGRLDTLARSVADIQAIVKVDDGIAGRLQGLEGWAKKNHELRDRDVVTEEYVDDKMEYIVDHITDLKNKQELLSDKMLNIGERLLEFREVAEKPNMDLMEKLDGLEANMMKLIEATSSKLDGLVTKERFVDFEVALWTELGNIESRSKTLVLDTAVFEELTKMYETEQHDLEGAVETVQAAEKNVLEAISGLRKDIDVENAEQKTEAFWKKLQGIVTTATTRGKEATAEDTRAFPVLQHLCARMSTMEALARQADPRQIEENLGILLSTHQTKMQDTVSAAIQKTYNARAHTATQELITATTNGSNAETKDLIRDEITKAFSNWKTEINRHAGIGNASYWKSLDTHLEKTLDARMGAMEEKMETLLQKKVDSLRAEVKAMGIKEIEDKIDRLERSIENVWAVADHRVDELKDEIGDIKMVLENVVETVGEIRDRAMGSQKKVMQMMEKKLDIRQVPEIVRHDWEWMAETRAE